jgi:hypothetical protein
MLQNAKLVAADRSLPPTATPANITRKNIRKHGTNCAFLDKMIYPFTQGDYSEEVDIAPVFVM